MLKNVLFAKKIIVIINALNAKIIIVLLIVLMNIKKFVL
jgi:hypothetical protein